MACGNAVREQLCLIKIETTAGTDASPDASDAIELEGGIIDPVIEAQSRSREVVNGGSVNGLSVVGAVKASFPFRVALRGSGTNNVAPKWARLLQAAHFTVTAGASDVDITPENQCDTLTAYLYRGTKLHKFLGSAVSGLTLKYDNGWMLSGTITGKYADVSEASAPASPVFDSGVLFNGLAPSFTMCGQSVKLRGFSMDFGATLAEAMDINDAVGYDRFLVTGFAPTGTVTIEDDDLSTFNWEDESLDDQPSATRAISFSFGTGAGSIVAISIPNIRIMPITRSNEGGLSVVECPFEATDSAGGANDWITITTS